MDNPKRGRDSSSSIDRRKYSKYSKSKNSKIQNSDSSERSPSDWGNTKNKK